MSTAPDQPRHAAGREPLSAQDEAALRAELEEVSERAVDAMIISEPVGWRAMLAAFVGSFVMFVGLVEALTYPFPGEGRTRPDSLRESLVGLALLAVGALLVLPASRGTVRGWREAARLRRRLVEIRALLPPGTAGPGLYRRFIDNRYRHPVFAVLFGIVLFLVLIVPILQRRL